MNPPGLYAYGNVPPAPKPRLGEVKSHERAASAKRVPELAAHAVGRRDSPLLMRRNAADTSARVSSKRLSGASIELGADGVAERVACGAVFEGG